MSTGINKVAFVCEDSKYGDMYPFFLSDALSNGASLVRKVFAKENAIYNIIRKIAFSNKLNKIVNGWMDLFPVGKYSVELFLEKNPNGVICFFNASLQRYYSGARLYKLKKKYPDSHFVLFYLDPMHMSSAFNATFFMKKYEGLFSVVYSIEQSDCEKYGLKKWNTLYSADAHKVEMLTKTQDDLYFCGVTKNRSADIISIIEGCEKHGIRNNFDVFYVYEDEPLLQELNQHMTAKSTSEMLSYGEVLNRVVQTNCILELVQANQDSLTVRAYEAVCYGKKLLTNNRSILDFKYYNPKYIQYFSDPETIDWDWIKRNDRAEYEYENDFSALKFVEMMYSDLEMSGVVKR